VRHDAAHDGEAGGQETVTKGKNLLDFRDFSAGNREEIARNGNRNGNRNGTHFSIEICAVFPNDPICGVTQLYATKV
jgi:hypothetical protein